jgi:hypothetical protein
MLKTAIVTAAFLMMLPMTARAGSMIDDIERADQQYQIERQREQLQQDREDMERQRARYEDELAHERLNTYLDPYGSDSDRPHRHY